MNAKSTLIWEHRTLKSDRGLTLEPRMRLSINKLTKNLVCLKGQLGKLIKNLVCLKVETRNFDRGLSFESAKRSSPIGVSISSQNERIPGSRFSLTLPRKRDTACS